MFFSGRKYRRVYCENVEEVLKITNISDTTVQILKARAPIFSFTRIDRDSFMFALQVGNTINTRIFRLGEEQQLERRNGTTIGVTYTLEDDYVLNQMVRLPDGRVAHFRREFGDRSARMIINVQGAHCQGYVYYEEVL